MLLQLAKYGVLFATLLLCAKVSLAATPFRGVWVTNTSLCDNGGVSCDNKREAGATVWLLQYGTRLCGEWSHGIYGGRVWGGNVIGFVQGNQARVRIGQDVQHSGSRPYPLQAAYPTLFKLRGGKLMWYADRGAQQVRYALRRAQDPLLLPHFNDQDFLRQCRDGVDFQ